MELFEMVLWMIYPYSVFIVLMMGCIWQYETSRVLENRSAEVKTGRFFISTLMSLFILSTITGITLLASTGFKKDPVLLLNWTISLIRFQPDIDLLRSISILSRIHLLSTFTFLLFLSFSKYLTYFLKPHQYIKSLKIKQAEYE